MQKQQGGEEGGADADSSHGCVLALWQRGAGRSYW